jgi:hypothetical protein
VHSSQNKSYLENLRILFNRLQQHFDRLNTENESKIQESQIFMLGEIYMRYFSQTRVSQLHDVSNLEICTRVLIKCMTLHDNRIKQIKKHKQFEMNYVEKSHVGFLKAFIYYYHQLRKEIDCELSFKMTKLCKQLISLLIHLTENSPEALSELNKAIVYSLNGLELDDFRRIIEHIDSELFKECNHEQNGDLYVSVYSQRLFELLKCISSDYELANILKPIFTNFIQLVRKKILFI